MLQGLEEATQLNIPRYISYEEANKYLLVACEKFDVKFPPPQTTTRLLDKVGHALNKIFEKLHNVS